MIRLPDSVWISPADRDLPVAPTRKLRSERFRPTNKFVTM